jgi:hypothetical protein
MIPLSGKDILLGGTPCLFASGHSLGISSAYFNTSLTMPYLPFYREISQGVVERQLSETEGE